MLEAVDLVADHLVNLEVVHLVVVMEVKVITETLTMELVSFQIYRHLLNSSVWFFF